MDKRESLFIDQQIMSDEPEKSLFLTAEGTETTEKSFFITSSYLCAPQGHFLQGISVCSVVNL
jgi:hypothetical protein